MRVTEGWEPQDVLYYFEKICQIPHGSGNTKQLSDYFVEFAKEHHLEVIQDSMNNIIIKKGASEGYEEAPPVIIQGHMDMVCEKDPAISSINMETDGLELIMDGEWLHANGTTLGGDDGIAIAMGMAILADDSIPHPEVELLATVDEEIGLLGAAGLDATPLKGNLLLNLDSEDDGFTAGCAGGMCAEISLPVVRENVNGKLVTVVIDGLKGGHSGGMIDKGRGNADILMGRFLYRLQKRVSFYLSALNGGTKDNAIPLYCKAELVTDDVENVKQEVEIFNEILKREYVSSDADVRITAVVRESASVAALNADSTFRVITLLENMPNGLQSLSQEISGLVQTSLNLGIMNLEENTLELSSGVRSSITSEKDALYEKLESISTLLGGHIRAEGVYPAWEFKPESRLREVASDAYRTVYGREANVQVIHAGLECGLFSDKIKDLDAISFGPQMESIHTSKERMNLPSVEKSYQLLKLILKEMINY